MTDQFQEVLEQDIKNATGATDVKVTFGDEEDITAVIDGVTYRHEAGSDDDHFVFVGPDDRTIEFPFSDEWLALI